MNGQQNRNRNARSEKNARDPIYRNPLASGQPPIRRNPQPRQGAYPPRSAQPRGRLNQRPDQNLQCAQMGRQRNGRVYGALKRLDDQRNPARRVDSTDRSQRGRTPLQHSNVRFGATSNTPLFQRSWFQIWMIALVLIAIATIIAVAVSSRHVDKEDYSQMSLSETTLTPQPPATEAPENDDGLFRAYVDDGTADMADDIDSGYGVLIDVAEGKILASKGAYEKINPASMTKLMTLIVAYENIADMNGYFEMTSAIIDPVYTADASLAGFSPGEKVLIKDLFYGAALPSGADATSALAICAAGDEDSFAVMMNAKAKELGLKDTHFENASGLHGTNHYSTCYDMAVIIKCAMDNEFLRQVISTYQYTTASTDKHPEGLKLENTMLSRMHGDEAKGFTIIGGKTGYTPDAGHCLASFGKRNSDGSQFILVTAKGSDRYTPVYDAIEVYGKYAAQYSDRAASGGYAP